MLAYIHEIVQDGEYVTFASLFFVGVADVAIAALAQIASSPTFAIAVLALAETVGYLRGTSRHWMLQLGVGRPPRQALHDLPF